MKFVKIIVTYLTAMMVFTGIILLRPGGVLIDITFSGDCKFQPSDQLLPSINLSDEDRSAPLTFLPPETIQQRLESTAKDIEGAPGDIILWVHGFRTDSNSAKCIAGRLKEAFEDHSPTGQTPRIITFSWPSSLSIDQFSLAQSHATQAAEYLSNLLDLIDPSRVTLVAHSLGGQVALEALLKSDAVKTAPIAQLVLVQAAVSHASIRSWVGERTVWLPSYGIEPPSDPTIEPIGPNSGCYVNALSRARRVTITSTRRDNVLSGPFATSTNIQQPCFGPFVFGGRETMNLMPGSLALGLPFRSPAPQCVAVPLPGPVEFDKEDSIVFPRRGHDWHTDDLIPPLPEITGFTPGAGRVCTSISFSLPRDDIDFVDLDAYRGLLIGDRHNPFANCRLRDAIIARITATLPRT